MEVVVLPRRRGRSRSSRGCGLEADARSASARARERACVVARRSRARSSSRRGPRPRPPSPIFGIAAALAHRRAARCAHRSALLFRVGAPAVARARRSRPLANQALTGECERERRHREARAQQPVHDERRQARRLHRQREVRGAPQPRLPLRAHRGRAHERARPASWRPRSARLPARTAWWAGVVPLALGSLPLAFARTRRIALVLWAQIVAWMRHRRAQRSGALAERALRDARRRVAHDPARRSASRVSLRSRARVHGRGGPARPSVVAMIVLGALIVRSIGVLTRPAGIAPRPSASRGCSRSRGGARRGACSAPVGPARADRRRSRSSSRRTTRSRRCAIRNGSSVARARNIRDQHLTLGKFLGELQAAARARRRRGRDPLRVGSTRPRHHRPRRLPRAPLRARRRARPRRDARAHRAHAPRPSAPTCSRSTRRGGACSPSGSRATSSRASPSRAT